MSNTKKVPSNLKSDILSLCPSVTVSHFALDMFKNHIDLTSLHHDPAQCSCIRIHIIIIIFLHVHMHIFLCVLVCLGGGWGGWALR